MRGGGETDHLALATAEASHAALESGRGLHGVGGLWEVRRRSGGRRWDVCVQVSPSVNLREHRRSELPSRPPAFVQDLSGRAPASAPAA